MSHQVIITFDLDENKIQENAEKEAGRQIAKQVVDEAFGSGYNRSSLLKNYGYEAVKSIIEEYKDQIIKEAIKEVAQSMARSKIVKEKLQEAIE